MDLDDDDDGLLDLSETTNPGPPASANSDSWTDQEIHDEWAFGRTPPLGPDSDLDGLPDGLELGYRTPRNPAETDLMADLDNDGWPNFIADLDPPFFNTLDNYSSVPGVSSSSIGGDRRKRVQGTVTDPNNPDTDHDGLPDGIEDANRNGWVDGDGASLPVTFLPWLERNWPDGKLESGDTWTETDPNNPDTDGDGLRDGDEDANHNGSIAGDLNGNRVYDAGESWAETNPLAADTDQDGLPDGWEVRYQFDPLDSGLDSLRTPDAADGAVGNGPDGNPDNDFIVVGGVTNAYTNLQEYNNGTNPREANVGGAVAAGSITIGPGPALGTINGRTYFEEFRDWTADDLVALDEYEGDGSNYQSGDVYPAYDGFDSSRDITAFYVRDGGDTGTGGDGKVYFRVDFQDLQAFAEEGNLDLYVVVDTGSAGTGERALPDDIDTVSDLRWEAVVAVYDSTHGRVYTDTNPVLNSSDYNQDLTAFGVQVRDENHADGFKGAYFNSELDAVEFAISRNALTLPEFPSAGWNGINIADLRFHVYTTKQGTANTPRGAGDIGGRSDIRDSIYDDWIAEDYWKSQASLRSVLGPTGFGLNGPNDRGKRAKFALLLHGQPAHQARQRDADPDQQWRGRRLSPARRGARPVRPEAQPSSHRDPCVRPPVGADRPRHHQRLASGCHRQQPRIQPAHPATGRDQHRGPRRHHLLGPHAAVLPRGLPGRQHRPRVRGAGGNLWRGPVIPRVVDSGAPGRRPRPSTPSPRSASPIRSSTRAATCSVVRAHLLPHRGRLSHQPRARAGLLRDQ
ncbi:MAG: hypothetical protein U1F87_18595 [Kiritimatiellia bacterium]